MIGGNTEMSHWRQLKQAANSIRLLGFVFAGVGAFPLLMILSERGTGLIVQLFTLCVTLVLTGPGVFYIVASAIIRRAELRVAAATMRVAAAHIALCILIL